MTTQSANQVKPSLFPLGKTLATPGAIAALAEIQMTPFDLLRRHQAGDWGDLDEEDKRRNGEALRDGSRVFSAYRFDAVKFWVITEADRSATTILLPEEY